MTKPTATESKFQRKLSRKISQAQLIQEPPDGGYGWLVLFGAAVAVSNFSVIQRCYSIFFNYLIEEFDSDYSGVAWMTAFISAGYGIACKLCDCEL